ncbi:MULTISPECIES: DUF1642 domain-containing protein [unclassified Enterococcus]|uniref:DUF1642 domain-containing protein n=1 Tax=unclassified Enterococcus TaxID=2608891 RepID=UPI00259B9853|nr:MULTISPECIES: DUF1642 domain-containing protein [unclassified Enterococcus]MDO0919872.1 DUF1642 domain-containing protein [Enterococcus sp. B1E2]WIV14327.1 DUF1642 domain-containing protein [Enterococcus sp. FZMF]
MNKQELTEMVKNAEVAAQTGINLIRRYKDEDGEYQRGQRNAYRDVATWIEEFDEQPKETVPKFVADWIKQCKEKATLADCLNGYYQISNGEVVSSEDFQNWVVDNENDELTAKAWIFGYEVKKEPLYQIELPGTSWGAYLTKADNGDLVIFQNTTSGSTFTESEIKAIDERYWAFAVLVEEVK